MWDSGSPRTLALSHSGPVRELPFWPAPRPGIRLVLTGELRVEVVCVTLGQSIYCLCKTFQSSLSLCHIWDDSPSVSLSPWEIMIRRGPFLIHSGHVDNLIKYEQKVQFLLNFWDSDCWLGQESQDDPDWRRLPSRRIRAAL